MKLATLSGVAWSADMTLKTIEMPYPIRLFCVALSFAIALGGCAESQRPVATGKGNIRAINGMVSSPELSFLVEERLQSLLGFKSGAAVRFDDLFYNINFDAILTGDPGITRIATQFVDVAADTEYIVSITGTLAAATTTVWQQPERIWEGGETTFEVSFGHLNGSIGQVDVYFEALGTAPAAGNSRGSIGNGEFIPAVELAAGDFTLILTAPGQPSDIIYTSPTSSPSGAVSLTYVFFDADPSITGPIGVRIMPSDGGSFEQPDLNSPPTIRTFHSAFGTGNYDAYINSDFSSAIATDIAFSGLSGDADVLVGDNTVNFTAAGNQGAPLLDRPTIHVAGTRSSLLLVGDPGNLTSIFVTDDRRPEETIGKLRVMHTAVNAGSVDVYVSVPGVDIADRLPTFVNIPQFKSTSYARLIAGNYEIRITPNGDKTVLAGPLQWDFETNGIAELALLDTADPNVFTLDPWTN